MLRKKKVIFMMQSVKRTPQRGRANETPQQYTMRLKRAMEKSPARSDPEAARKFLAKLSMYNESGQLKEKY